MKILYLPNQYSQQRQRDKKAWVYPVHLAMEAEWHRQQGDIVFWEYSPCSVDKVITEPEGLPFCDLPIPNRIFTDAFANKYQTYGNYKYHPATHMMAALDCWYAKCTFCEWAKKYPEVQTRDVVDVATEVNECISLGFKEIFDDSGTFPVGDWLNDFCHYMKNSTKKVVLGCNMRIVTPYEANFRQMKEVGFRMVLFGMESVNQFTLDNLNKGIRAEDIIPCIKRASDAGLEPHISCMTGYPWETLEEEMRTINVVKFLLRKGYAKTAQASVYSMPGVPTIDKAIKHKIYECAYHGDFWINKMKDIHKWQDFIFLLKGIRKGIVHD